MDINVATIWESPSAQKYINMMFLGYGTDIKNVEANLAHMHSDIHQLIKKLNPSTVLK